MQAESVLLARARRLLCNCDALIPVLLVVARDRDVEQERKEMQRKLLDEQVQLKQKLVEDEKHQDKEVLPLARL